MEKKVGIVKVKISTAAGHIHGQNFSKKLRFLYYCVGIGNDCILFLIF